MDQTKMGCQEKLIEGVIERGICVACGACVGLCPYFQYFDGKVVVMDRCNSDTGRCLQVCPRADDRNLPAGDPADPVEPLGPYRKVLMARARQEKTRERGQYGGTVSAILGYALEKGLIRAAVLTDKGGDRSPAGLMARSPSEVLDCAGSRYTASGPLAALNRAVHAGEESLGIVGLPCQMEALARLQETEPEDARWGERIRIRIGLFCTWAVDFRELGAYLSETGIPGPVRKYDIPPPPAQVFKVLTDRKDWKEIPLDAIRPFILKGCSHCRDMTAEFSDISVGAVEGVDGWNTVVIRSRAGRDLFDDAVRDMILETEDLPGANLEHLKEASANKRGRGRANREQFAKDIS